MKDLCMCVCVCVCVRARVCVCVFNEYTECINMCDPGCGVGTHGERLSRPPSETRGAGAGMVAGPGRHPRPVPPPRF